MTHEKKTSPLLADFQFNFSKLPLFDQHISSFESKDFLKKTESQRYSLISQALLESIQKADAPCFLLPEIVRFIDALREKGILKEYTLENFEFWLNQFSNVDDQEQQKIRGKIMGRFIPRNEYQTFFPIGSKKRLLGSHTVTGHGSPDLDTIVASFWGWVDAFSARISEGQHLWNVPPGGLLQTKDAPPLTSYFGQQIFDILSQNRSSLALSAIDLATQASLIKKTYEDSTLDSEHIRHKNACMIVDEKGYFLGDLRTADYEGIRQIQALVTHCLIWFENHFHNQFISLFTQEKVTRDEIQSCIEKLFAYPLYECLDTKNLQASYLDHFKNYLEHVLKLSNGLNSSFLDFAKGLKLIHYSGFSQFEKSLKQAFDKESLYDEKGVLKESRERLFKHFQDIINQLDQILEDLQKISESVSIALKIKSDVFKFSPRFVKKSASLEELKDKMSVFHHLSMVFPNKDQSLWPMGIIRSKDLNESVLGTVSLRDFCNRDEVKIASYLEIISVVDHHKTDLKTKNAPVVITGDVQSCNILLAEKNFELNDRFLLSSYDVKKVLNESLSLDTDLKLLKRQLTVKIAATGQKEYFIDSNRVFLEYLSYLYAIIDDTDLFSKVTFRDLRCIAELINRMKSIQMQSEVQVIDISGLEEDPKFIEKAKKAIVKDPDMYSLYSKIFEEKEHSMNQSLIDAANGKSFDIFSDVKEQSGCCRIGQTKIFSTNATTLQKQYDKLLNRWVEKAEEVYENNSSLDLHIHMVSTIPNAQEVYSDDPTHYLHQDYLWIWVPPTKQAFEHLANFLNAFSRSKYIKENHLTYQVIQDQAEMGLKELFNACFKATEREKRLQIQKKAPVSIFAFDAGTLNSRKAHITPYLPVLVK